MVSFVLVDLAPKRYRPALRHVLSALEVAWDRAVVRYGLPGDNALRTLSAGPRSVDEGLPCTAKRSMFERSMDCL